MKVWVVSEDTPVGHHVLGAFSSKDKAVKFQEQEYADSITCFELDKQ